MYIHLSILAHKREREGVKRDYTLTKGQVSMLLILAILANEIKMLILIRTQ